MDFNKILNQVLGVAKETMNSNATSDKVAKIGGGAAVIGALSMLLGRNGGSKLAKLGSLAALGSIAYKAYQDYQQKNANAENLSETQFLAEEPNSSRVILQAMIAAAASDGEISAQERQAIFSEAGNDAELQQWITQEMTKPASISEIAQQVTNEALAAQVYLAARAVCADLERKEIIFLANLAEALRLSDAFVEQLEKQAGF